jgi:DNA processing protein
MDLKMISMAYWIQEHSRRPWRERIQSFIRYQETGEPPFGFDLSDARLLELDRQIDKSLQQGVQFVYLFGDDYPESLSTIEDPPLVLSYRGNWPQSAKPALAVVGGRQPCSDSIRWLDVHLSRFIQATGATIISGGAYGIDRKAHLVSLLCQTSTLNFQPCGILRPYPQFWREEWDEFIYRGGVFVSEFLPEMPVSRHHFVRRNRLISGMASSVLIVGAGARSGTLLTAELALTQGKSLFVLPGHPMDPRFEGSLRLLSEGGTFVRDYLDLVGYFKVESAFSVFQQVERPFSRFEKI